MHEIQKETVYDHDYPIKFVQQCKMIAITVEAGLLVGGSTLLGGGLGFAHELVTTCSEW